MQVILELAADLGITAADAHADPAISELTEGRSELVCLALWLISERGKVCPLPSMHANRLTSFPRPTPPVLVKLLSGCRALPADLGQGSITKVF